MQKDGCPVFPESVLPIVPPEVIPAAPVQCYITYSLLPTWLMDFGGKVLLG